MVSLDFIASSSCSWRVSMVWVSCSISPSWRVFNSDKLSCLESMTCSSLCLVSIFNDSTCSWSSRSLGSSSGCSRRWRALRIRWAMASCPRELATSERAHSYKSLLVSQWTMPPLFVKSYFTFCHLATNVDGIQVESVGSSLEQKLNNVLVSKVAGLHQSCPAVLSSPLQIIRSGQILINDTVLFYLLKILFGLKYPFKSN